MHKRSRRISVAVLSGVALIAPLWATPATATATANPAQAVVTSGLNNPRQLSLTPDGVLLVAEAGKGSGGNTNCVTGPEGPMCVGTTGSITAIKNPWSANNQTPHRVITGLLSGAGPDGSAAVGSDGVSADQDGHNNAMWIQETFAPPGLPAGIDTSTSGKLLFARPYQTPQIRADISQYEKTHDPDGMGFDSDPYAVLDLGDHRLVADAAANDILSVDSHGHISTFHVFHNITSSACTTPTADSPGYDPTRAFPGCNFVPTSLAQAPDGDIIVGGLSSLMPGQAQVVVLSRSGNVEHVYTGFTSVTGVAIGPDGAIYVSQLQAPEQHPANPQITGVLTRISTNGHRDDMDIPFPAGLLVDRHNNVFVSVFSIAPDTGLAGPQTSGQVWKLRF